MTVRAKTLVKDKFWIVEQNGQKLGTLQKQADNGWIFLSKQQSKEVFHTQESLFTKFGFGMFDESNIKKPEEEIPKSKSQFCAGYYIICFEKGWRKAYCPKMITLSRYDYKGPIKTKLEMQQVLNDAVKQFQDTN